VSIRYKKVVHSTDLISVDKALETIKGAEFTLEFKNKRNGATYENYTKLISSYASNAQKNGWDWKCDDENKWYPLEIAWKSASFPGASRIKDTTKKRVNRYSFGWLKNLMNGSIGKGKLDPTNFK
jgi:hypothetical protein